MRRLIYTAISVLALFCLFLLCITPSTAQTLTPNIQLQVPNYNQSNWQVPIIYDLNRLDLFLSGNIQLSALNLTAVACNGSYGTPGQFLGTTGSACQWISVPPTSYPGVTSDGSDGLIIADNLSVGSGLTVRASIISNSFFTLFNNSTASSTGNFSAPPVNLNGAFWTGAASATDGWQTTAVLGTGANPTSTYTWSHTGSSGLASLSIPYLVTTASLHITGATAVTSLTQTAANATGGKCSMVAATSCTITIGTTYTTPVCMATQQSATLTGGAVGCTVSGTTVTITSAVANSETWGAFVFGSPN
jgi:hypothetical protein